MNKYQKKLNPIIVLLGVLVCLTGCTNTSLSPKVRVSESPAVTEAGLENNSPIIVTTPQEHPVNTEKRNIVETVNDDFHIDADVVGYPIDGMASVYTAEPKDFTKEEIKAFIAHCDKSIESVKEWDDGAMQYFDGECTSGYRFGYMWGLDGINNHPYAEFHFYDTKRYRTYYDYPIYSGGEQNYITNPQYTVGWMFTEPKEFPFATEKEAEASIREALAVLGLPNLTLLRTLYIDHHTLEEAGELLAKDEYYAPIFGKAENNGYKLRDDWSEEEDAYMFSFGISIAGVPMSYLFDDSGETATYCGSEVNVWYTKYGITFLGVNTPWTVGAEEVSREQIISAEAALETAKEKYSYDLHMQDKKIEEIRLLYKYAQNRNQWLLRPAWTVRISYTNEHSDERYYRFMYIDALTGKEL